jgi:hypothetical protein
MLTFKKYAAATTVLILLACQSSVWAKPSAMAAPQVDGKAIAEKIIRPNQGLTALVFNEKGEVMVVNREGLALPACQVCSPELEASYGPKCSKARQMSVITKAMTQGKQIDTTVAATKKSPLICDKLMHTDVLNINPITVIKHTGSECFSFVIHSDGEPKIFQICW